jgi:hypothetical protein
LGVLRWIEERAPDTAEVKGLELLGAFAPSWPWDVSVDDFERYGTAAVPFDSNTVGCESVTKTGLAGFLARMELKQQV